MIFQETADFWSAEFKFLVDYFLGDDADENSVVPSPSYFYYAKCIGHVEVWNNGTHCQAFTCNLTYNSSTGGEIYQNFSPFALDTSAVSDTLKTNIETWYSGADFNAYLSKCNFNVPAGSFYQWNPANIRLSEPYIYALRNLVPQNNYYISTATFDYSNPPTEAQISAFLPNNPYSYNQSGFYCSVLNNVTRLYNNNNTQRVDTTVYTSGSTSVEFAVDAGGNSLYFRPSSDTFTYKDIVDIFNVDIFPQLKVDLPDIIAPDITFPNIYNPVVPSEQVPPITQPVYVLEIPDGVEYLDTSTEIIQGFSSAGDIVSYIWDEIVDLGIAPILIFGIISTFVISRLRGG